MTTEQMFQGARTEPMAVGREFMARGFRGVGFPGPKPPRDPNQPKSELGKRYAQWLEGFDEGFRYWTEKIEQEYRRAFNLIDELELDENSIVEANSLLVLEKTGEISEKAYKASGLFVSAVYNKVNPITLIFDIDAPDIDCIGYRFNGFLVNKGKVGDLFGESAAGPVINNGETGDWFGYSAAGPVINNGEAGDWFGWYAKGPVIAIEEPTGYRYLSNSERVLKPADCARIPELKKYIGSIGKKTKAFQRRFFGTIFA